MEDGTECHPICPALSEVLHLNILCARGRAHDTHVVSMLVLAVDTVNKGIIEHTV